MASSRRTTRGGLLLLLASSYSLTQAFLPPGGRPVPPASPLFKKAVDVSQLTGQVTGQHSPSGLQQIPAIASEVALAATTTAAAVSATLFCHDAPHSLVVISQYEYQGPSIFSSHRCPTKWRQEASTLKNGFLLIPIMQPSVLSNVCYAYGPFDLYALFAMRAYILPP